MKNVLEFLEKTAEHYPDKVGFTDSVRKATFAQVRANAKAVGTFLLQCGSRRPVAVLIDKTVNCIDVMLGSLYANDFYVVVDVHSPQDRILNIITTLDNPLIVADKESEELAKSLGRDYFVYEDMISTEIDEVKLALAMSAMCDMDTAYILFTSGSTGMPKGTVISHRALISYINWVSEEFKFDETTSFGSQTPLYFSMSVTDFYSTVKCGCTYHIIPKQFFTFPIKLVEFLNENKINTIYWVPTAISLMPNFKVLTLQSLNILKQYCLQEKLCPQSSLITG